MSERSEQLITGLFCPGCGYDMTGQSRAERVTCPECGGECPLERLLTCTPATRLKRRIRNALVLTTITLILAANLFMAIVVFAPFSQRQARSGPHRPLSATVRMKLVHQSTLASAREFGEMPKHVALLMAHNYVNSDLYLDPALNTGTLLLGDVDLMWFNWTDDTVEELKDTVDDMDVANSVYSFGDFSYVGWVSAPTDARLIFSWSMPDSNGTRKVCFMDNTVRSVSQREWQAMWDQDAAARTALGLPALQNR